METEDNKIHIFMGRLACKIIFFSCKINQKQTGWKNIKSADSAISNMFLSH